MNMNNILKLKFKIKKSNKQHPKTNKTNHHNVKRNRTSEVDITVSLKVIRFSLIYFSISTLEI